MSPPTLDQLRHFHVLARHGSYARAAAELNLSQPALTRSVQALERSIGTRLLERERGRQGLTLTPAGREILSTADAVLAQVNSLQVVGSAARGTSELHFGIGPQFATVFLPTVLDRLTREMPDLAVTVSVGSTDGMLEQLLRGDLEFFLSGEISGERPARVRCAKFASEPLRYAVRKEHPLLKVGEIGVDDIARFPRLAGTVFRDRLLSQDDSLVERLRPSVTIDNFEVLASLTRSTDAILATSPRGIRPPLVELPFDLSALIGITDTFLYSLVGFRFTPAAAAAVDQLSAGLV